MKTLEEFCTVDTGDQNPIARAAFDVLDLPIPNTNNRGSVSYFDTFIGEWRTLHVATQWDGNC